MVPSAGELVVLDLEYTAWKGSLERNWSGEGEYMEVIQIGAVRVDADDGFREAGHLSLIVRPTLNPILSDYITGLTGITNDDLRREGIDLAAALAALNRFCAPDLPILSNGADGLTLLANLALARQPSPIPAHRFRDISELLSKGVGTPGAHVSSCDLPGRLGLAVSGQRHDALHDARCVAGAIAALRARGKL